MTLPARSLLPVILLVAMVTATAATERPVTIRITMSERAELETLTRMVGIDDVRGLEVSAVATPDQLRALDKAGYTWQPVPDDRSTKTLAACPPGWENDPQRPWDCYPTYDQYVGLLHRFATDHPSLCRLYDIGDSNNQVRPHDLWVVKISDHPDLAEDEPEVLYTSTMHGDETTGYVLMLRLIDDLLTGYGTDQQITDLVDGLEIWVNPLANPDGTYYSSDASVSGAIRHLVGSDGSSYGPDPNRNFPDPDDGPHPDGWPYWPETVAMMDLAAAHTFVLSANFHGGAEVVNYPWDTWARYHVDDQWFIAISRAYADLAQADSPAGYMTDLDNGITNGYAWYEVAGGRQDYMTYFEGGREVTIELSGNKLPPSSDLPAYWSYNRRALLNYVAEAFAGVRGTVTGDGGEPVAATLEVVGHDSQADSSYVHTDPAVGDYHRMLLPGVYTVRCSAYGYETGEVGGIAVTDGAATVRDVVLHALPSQAVSGLVTTPAARLPVVGATVALLDTPLDPATTDSDGRYAFSSVVDGTYSFQVSAGGFETLVVERTVGAGSTVHDFVLAPYEVAFGSDLEADDGGLVASGVPAPGWQWGVPTTGPSAHSGERVWATRLGGEYVDNAHWYLDLTGVEVPESNPRLSFWHWYEIESSWDGGNVSLSTNGGASFQILHPDGGYPDDEITALGEPGYTGSTGDWTQATFDLGAWAGQTVTLRWHFATDSSQTRLGWYLDDLAISGLSYAADFEHAPALPSAGEPVAFTDRSSGPVQAWSWDFGDGATSTEQHPTHAFAAAGTYQVTLEVTLPSGPQSRTRPVEVLDSSSLIFADGYESGDTTAWAGTTSK